MEQTHSLELDLKRLIIEIGNLEDLQPEDIPADLPLFAEGLGLDSIDALEIAMALASTYEVTLSRDDPDNRRHFRTVTTLAELVRAKGKNWEIAQ
jgi:acyl carrier protein